MIRTALIVALAAAALPVSAIAAEPAKPEAPPEIRGIYQTIGTNVTGLRVGYVAGPWNLSVAQTRSYGCSVKYAA